MNRILPLVLLVAACGKSDHGTPQPAPAQKPALEHASQADLAKEIADAERLGTWHEIEQRWQGQTLRWTVTRQRLLCSSATDCNVAAFPIQRPAQQGWMPLLTFAPGQYDALAQACDGKEQCEVTVEGILSELEVSPELPTKVVLSKVRLVPGPASQTKMAHN